MAHARSIEGGGVISVTEKYIGILFHTQLNKYLLQYSRWNK